VSEVASGPTAPRELDPEAADLLARLQEMGMRPYEELGGVLRARSAIEGGRWMQEEKAEIRTRDVLVAGDAGRLPARVYHPEPGAVLPLVVHLHGGGWVGGSIAAADRPCRTLALASGCVVVSVEYRLAPENPFPAPLRDCVAATRWLAEHAAEIGADGRRIAVMGDSAGGNLAAATALVLRDEGGPAISHQVLLYPALDQGGSYPSRVENATGYLLTAGSMEWFREHYFADPADPHASPLRADHLRGLPSATIVVAGFDPLRDEGVAYADRLRGDGVAVELLEWPGMVHGFFWMAGELQAARDLAADLAVVLRRELRAAHEADQGTDAVSGS
jgi:acetyl esterase